MKKLLTILICGIMMVTITACGSEKASDKKETKKDTTSESSNKTENKTEATISECAKEGNICSEEDITKGQLVQIAVNDDEVIDFYVIADDGEKVTLMTDGTFNVETAFVSADDIKGVCKDEEDGKSCGPYTALKTLNEKTANWTNIKTIKDYNYDVIGDNVEDHYQNIKVTNGEATITGKSGKTYAIPGETKARMATSKELQALKNKEWLTNKISELYDNKSIKNFFVLSSTPSYGGYDGTVSVLSCKYTIKMNKINVDDALILLPVIELNKADIK